MPSQDRKALARQMYEAFAAADRDLIERLLADDFESTRHPTPTSTGPDTSSGAGATPAPGKRSTSCA